jgi:hypothetical protein
MKQIKEKRLEILEKIFGNMVDYWHESDSVLQLHEFLGISWDEYCDLV